MSPLNVGFAVALATLALSLQGCSKKVLLQAINTAADQKLKGHSCKAASGGTSMDFKCVATGTDEELLCLSTLPACCSVTKSDDVPPCKSITVENNIPYDPNADNSVTNLDLLGGYHCLYWDSDGKGKTYLDCLTNCLKSGHYPAACDVRTLPLPADLDMSKLKDQLTQQLQTLSADAAKAFVIGPNGNGDPQTDSGATFTCQALNKVGTDQYGRPAMNQATFECSAQGTFAESRCFFYKSMCCGDQQRTGVFGCEWAMISDTSQDGLLGWNCVYWEAQTGSGVADKCKKLCTASDQCSGRILNMINVGNTLSDLVQLSHTIQYSVYPSDATASTPSNVQWLSCKAWTDSLGNAYQYLNAYGGTTYVADFSCAATSADAEATCLQSMNSCCGYSTTSGYTPGQYQCNTAVIINGDVNAYSCAYWDFDTSSAASPSFSSCYNDCTGRGIQYTICAQRAVKVGSPGSTDPASVFNMVQYQISHPSNTYGRRLEVEDQHTLV